MRLTTRDVAEILNTSSEAVHKLVQTGVLKAFRRGKGSPLIFDSRSVYLERVKRQEKASA